MWHTPSMGLVECPSNPIKHVKTLESDGAKWALGAAIQLFISASQGKELLTHWGRVTHICVNKLTIIGWDNGLSPDRRQAIIWTNAGILLIGTLGTDFSEILIEILTFSFKKMRLKVSSARQRPFNLGLSLLKMAAILCTACSVVY